MTRERKLVVASANPDKAAEIMAILSEVPGLVLLPRPSPVPDVEETGDTLVDNARLKARALVEATGMAAVSDDTGLEVDALGGAPGVYSARFAGDHASYADNVAKLLAELDRVGADDPDRRHAKFRSVAMVAWPDGTDVWEAGEVSGHHRTGGGGRLRVRVRPRLHPGRLRGAHLRPDDRRGEASDLPPWARLPRSGGTAGLILPTVAEELAQAAPLSSEPLVLVVCAQGSSAIGGGIIATSARLPYVLSPEAAEVSMASGGGGTVGVSSVPEDSGGVGAGGGKVPRVDPLLDEKS